MYINAEYLIDVSKIKAIGDFLDIDGPDLIITQPRLINEASANSDYLSVWKNMKHGFYPCGSCKLSNCVPADADIVNQVCYDRDLIFTYKCFTSIFIRVD